MGTNCPRLLEQIKLMHPVLPLIVCTLCLEDHATQMQCALAEHMNLMLRAVADCLHMVVTPTDGDDAYFFGDGLDEVTHYCSPVMMSMS